MHILRHMFLLLGSCSIFLCLWHVYIIWSRSHPETASTVRPSWRRALRCFDPTTHPLIFPLFINVPIIPKKYCYVKHLALWRFYFKIIYSEMLGYMYFPYCIIFPSLYKYLHVKNLCIYSKKVFCEFIQRKYFASGVMHDLNNLRFRNISQPHGTSDPITGPVT